MGPSTGPARVCLALLLAVGVTAGAPGSIVSGQVPRHAVYVSVTDKSGNAVQDVDPSSFVVREDKAMREVMDVALADEPLQIALLVDNSQASESYIRDYREALAAFITGITSDNPSAANGKHQIAIVTLASRPTILKDYSSDAAQLIKSAQSIFALPGTGTNLLDGIAEISEGLTKRTTARPVIVALISEGPEMSARRDQTVMRALKASGAALHVIKVGRPSNTSEDRALVIGEGTKQTGGRNEELLASSSLTAKMKQVATDLTRQYRISYTRPDSLIPPETLTVTVGRPGLTVRSTAAREERPSVRR